MFNHDDGATVRLAATIARSRYDAEDGVVLAGLHSETLVEMALAAKREVDGLRTELAEARAERDEARQERDDANAIGRAVLRALEPMDDSGELTRADRIDYIATSMGEDSWTHDVLRAIAGALRAHAASATKGGEYEPRSREGGAETLPGGPESPRPTIDMDEPPQPDAGLCSCSRRLGDYCPTPDPACPVHGDRTAAGRCEECADGTYPYYGGAPGRDYAGPSEKDITYTHRDGSERTIAAGSFVFAQRKPSPRETWPANFTEDPECPELGTWECPACNGTGRKGER